MSSRSSSSRQRRVVERPTLPPIRDLFHDLRVPHDSPSLTLARLRVRDDPGKVNSYDHISTSSVSSEDAYFAQQLPPDHSAESQTDHGYHYGERHPHQTQSTSLLTQLHGSDDQTYQRPRSHEQIAGYGSPYDDPRRRSERYHSMSSTQEPLGLPGYLPVGSATPIPPQMNAAMPPNFHYDYRYASETSVAHYPSPNGQPEVRHPPRPSRLSTSLPSAGALDDEKTPIASFIGGPQRVPPLAQNSPDDTSGLSRYECSYCGKGFNRPSSLKIHLNSHTGEKPFVCPVDSCGRSFSVLSNMRRHARVHTQAPLQQQQDFPSDEESEQIFFSGSHFAPSNLTSSHIRSTGVSTTTRRRNSNASASSTTSRQSYHDSDEEAPTISVARPEKRSRRHDDDAFQ